MFRERRKDRRRSYSFRAHLKRAIATKGLRRLMTPVFGTALAATLSFAYCSSDSITGPSGHDGTTTGGTGVEVTPFPVTEEEIPTTLAGVEVPTEMQATACNGDVVAWDEGRTRGGGVSYFNPKTQRMRVVIKIDQHAKGHGTRSLTDPTFPKRWYVGFEQYEKEVLFAPGTSETTEEFDLHIIAKDERETRMFQDDYMLRLKVYIAVRNGALVMKSSTYEKCF